MKKVIYLLVLFTLFSSCDDGDIVLENLNFGNAQVTSCGAATNPSGLLFKTSGSQLLLIDIPATIFDTVLSTNTNPKLHTITANQIIYRKYSGNTNKNIICDMVPPASPTVIDQWVGQPGGTIEVITSEINTTNTTTGITSLTGYSHVIRFKNVQLKNDQNSFFYEDYYFGEYVVTVPQN